MTLASCTAVIVCELPVPIQVLGLLSIALWTTHSCRALKHNRVIRHYGGADDTENLWTLANEGARATDGKLIHSGYRSAGLLVIVVRETDSHKIHRIPVWRDSVTALEYSYLNLQLMFNTGYPDTSSRSLP